MPGGRPPGPLRNYTISGAWPSSPGRFRATVLSVDEKTARDSVSALARMHCSVRIEMSFHKADRARALLGQCLAAQWNQDGSIATRHTGEYAEHIPAWVTGQEPVDKEKTSEPADSPDGSRR